MAHDRRSTLRLVLEGGTIVASILVAFGIDAWWDGRTESHRVSEHFDQLSVQLEANFEVLGQAREEATRAIEAADVILELVEPRAVVLSSDSLAYLLGRTLRVNPGVVELSAVEAILSEGALGAASGASVQQNLITYRNLAEAFALESRRFSEARVQLVDHLIEAGAPFAVISGGPTGSATEFPLPVEALLGDVSLESRVYHLQLLARRLMWELRQLEDSSDSLLTRLDQGAI